MVRAATRGTERRDALRIAEEAELLGGSISGSADADSFGWSISVPVRHVAAAVELLADVVQNPAYRDDIVEIERAVAIADVAAVRDDMYRYPLRLAMRAAYPDDPYGVPVGGTAESLAGLDADALREWHLVRVLHAPLVIGLVGDADADELAALAASAFSELSIGDASLPRAAAWPAAARVEAEARDRAQSAMALLLPAPSRLDDDRFAAEMIATVASGLGGRFFDELRDKQSLCYTVQAFASERRRAGIFATYIATSPDKEDRARDALFNQLELLREQPVTARELARAQTYAIGIHAIRQQSGGAVLGDMVDAWLFGALGELSAYEHRVRAVTPDAMQQVARRYFDLTRRVEGIVRGVAKIV
jgi:zinc protease